VGWSGRDRGQESALRELDFAGLPGIALVVARRRMRHNNDYRLGQPRHETGARFLLLQDPDRRRLRCQRDVGSSRSRDREGGRQPPESFDAGVSSGTLHLGLKPGTAVQNATLNANVTAPTLSDIEVGGAGQVHLFGDLSGQNG
jgi:hypothetical protein